MGAKLFLVLVSYLLTILVSFIVIRERKHLIVFFTFITGFFFYSVLGLALFEVEDTFLHAFNIFLFCLILLIIGCLSSIIPNNREKYSDKVLTVTYQRHQKIIITLAWIYIGTYIFTFIYPNIKVVDIFKPFELLDNFSALSSRYKFEKKQDGLYRIVTSQLRVMTMPFFYINLYRIKRHKYKFIVLYLLPIYLKAMDNMYLSRNEILLSLMFIIIFLYIEKYIKFKQLVMIIILLSPLLIIGADIFTSLRVGNTGSVNGILESLYRLISEEANFPIYYAIEDRLSYDIDFYKFILYLICLPIPFFLKNKLLTFNFPELPIILSEKILGLKYGTYGFYLLLPAVLGEGIMLFGKNFSFMYAFIVGIYVFCFTRILTSNDCLKYLFVYYILDILRQTRGGAQSIFSQWTNTLFYLYIILFIIGLMINKSIIKGRKLE